MVEITADKKLGIINLRVSGDNFQDTIETLKLNGVKWNPSTKFWNTNIVNFDDIVTELNYEGEVVEVSALTKKDIQDYIDGLKELEISKERRILKLDLLNFPPLKGKPPFENYQSEDLGRALTRNRFLFNWEMGLGKSFALAALIENLRFYKLINKCIIFSTGVGVFNLKNELCKFGKNIKPEEIFVINSITDLKDRDLFNSEKYPYTILIMTYDTFKGINNYYYDSTKGTKSKPHPSQNTDYKKSYVPIKDWLEGFHGALFMDESHSLANPKSRRSEIMDMNLMYFKYRYEFTGTLADKYEKLYEQLKILDRALVRGKSYNDWLKEYNDVGNKFSSYAVNPEGWNIEKIGELNYLLLKDYAAKRKMIECLDLPLDYDVPEININMSHLHRKIYENFVKQEISLAQQRKLAGEATVKDSIMNMFGIFQLACENVECIRDTPSFEKFPEELQNDIMNYDWFKDNAKVPVIEAVLEERVVDEKQRGIVWYYHPKTKDNLVKLLKKYNPIVIEAGMGPEKMTDAINEFKKNDKHKIIIASINIMNTSVTLTECKWNLYVERTFNYTIYSQSRGRIFRPGQTEVCRTYMMCFNNSIDNLQLQNLKQKGLVLESLLNKNIVDQRMWRMIFNATGKEKWD